MSEQKFTAGAAVPAALRAALPRLLAGFARNSRLAAAERAETSRLLSDDDLRQAADRDPEAGSHLGRVADALAERDRAAAAWQAGLAEVTQQWEASLAKLARLHLQANEY